MPMTVRRYMTITSKAMCGLKISVGFDWESLQLCLEGEYRLDPLPKQQSGIQSQHNLESGV